MATINISTKTKKRFKKNKLIESSIVETSLTEDDFIIILLNYYEDKNER